MTTDQEAHLQSLKDTFVKAVDEKYRKGEAEHGGDLWLKAGIIDMALEEVIDQWVYLKTLQSQLATMKDKFDAYTAVDKV